MFYFIQIHSFKGNNVFTVCQKLFSFSGISFVGFVESHETSESELGTSRVMNISNEPQTVTASSFKMDAK